MSRATNLAGASGLLAIVQIADSLIGVCKVYIEAVEDAPRGLKLTLIEISTAKAMVESLQYLMDADEQTSATMQLLDLGLVEGCILALTELDQLIGGNVDKRSGSKRAKLGMTLARLAWPLNENKVRDLVGEIVRFKGAINFVLSSESA
jgi:hypothetical protein